MRDRIYKELDQYSLKMKEINDRLMIKIVGLETSVNKIRLDLDFLSEKFNKNITSISKDLG
jgi:hypothetical protein